MNIANSTQSKFIDIKKIRLDGGTQFRESINQDKAKEYKELMLEDVVFKPVEVVFDGENYYLVDGFHRYFAIKSMGVDTIEAKVTEGTLQDAIRIARRSNSAHGMPRSQETKRRVVMSALNDPENEGAASREIAKECQVSHTLVLNIIKSLKAGINSKVTEKSSKDLGINSKESGSSTTPTQSDADPKPSMTEDFAPSEDELKANQRAFEADIQAMNKLLEASEPLAIAHAEIKKLNLDYANLESRFNALMREKNKAVELLQKVERELDRIKRRIA